MVAVTIQSRPAARATSPTLNKTLPWLCGISNRSAKTDSLAFVPDTCLAGDSLLSGTQV